MPNYGNYRNQDIINWLSDTDVERLFEKANRIRKTYCGDEVHIRGIIEFSNFCCRSCLYCGLRKENKNISRYRLSEDKIVNLAKRIAHSGIRTIVLQSGDDLYYTQKVISNIIRRIKNENSGVAITLSIGERAREALLPCLETIQDRCGYIPKDAITYLRKELGVPSVDIYGVITFYGMLTAKKQGRT